MVVRSDGGSKFELVIRERKMRERKDREKIEKRKDRSNWIEGREGRDLAKDLAKDCACMIHR